MSRVVVNLDLNKRNFDGPLHGVKEQLGELKGMVAAAFTVEAVKAMIEKTVEYADMIDKASLRMKLNTDTVQTLGIVAQDAGSSLETVEKAFQKIAVARAKALGGDKTSLDAFKKLGVDEAGLKNGSTVDIAAKVAKGASEGSNQVQGVALADLGLKGAAGDLTAIGDELGHLAEKTAELKGIGAIISDEDIANIAEMKDQIELLEKQAMAKFAPIISFIFEAWQRFYVVFKAEWSNIFAFLIESVTHTVDFIKGTFSHLFSAETLKGFLTGGIGGALNAKGKDGQSVASITKDLAVNLFHDVKGVGTGIAEDIKDGMAELDSEKKARDEKRTKLRTDNKLGDDEMLKQTADKKPKTFTDAATAIGQFLGASFRKTSGIVNSEDIAKRHLDTSKNIEKTAVRQVEVLGRIENNTKPKPVTTTAWI